MPPLDDSSVFAISAYDQDFLHTVRGLPYQEVRKAIDTAFREHTTMNLTKIELDQSSEGSGRYVSFTIMSMQIENGGRRAGGDYAQDVTGAGAAASKRLEAVQHEQLTSLAN